ncbi:hypothetical protein [Asticcacaulis sp. YBE204]|uniref:hypothetical protein n=1 Tax=Asticcacaulis sp. YBE204 TaxID=1282363 RepID=UPI0003C4021E|nr:hypothetical protein [Asticcacaulis sp. YBE204]ESQ78796.1 hypothetical protein AEYBE204_12495 [Asticcacaulis sp. YBE204]
MRTALFAVVLTMPFTAAAAPTQVEKVSYAPFCGAIYMRDIKEKPGTPRSEKSGKGYTAAWEFYKVNSGKREIPAYTDMTVAAKGLDENLKQAGMTADELRTLCDGLFLTGPAS